MPFELTQRVLRSTGESAVPAASELVRYLHASRPGDGSYVTEELLSEINADALVYRLYLAHLTQVRRYVASLVPLADVDDIVADTFALALTKSDKIPENLGLAWLLKSAKYLANNHNRRHRNADFSLESDAGYVQFQTTDEYERADVGLVVRSAMDQLPPKEREAVMLFTFEQLDSKQCARIAGCTVNTYNVRLHRGKMKLKELLADLDLELGGDE